MLTIHGNENVETSLYATYSDLGIVSVAFQRATVGQRIELSDGVTALPLVAEHADQYEQALNYVLSVGERNLLIGNDTGWYSCPTWEALVEIGLDVAVLDCTSGGVVYRQHHMGVAAVAEMKQEMLRRGILREGSRVIANHFSHNGHMLHDQLCAYFEPHGIEVGYDGMNVEL